MNQNEFNHLVRSVPTLSPEQMELLRNKLESYMAAPRSERHHTSEESAYALLRRAGVIGCIEGKADSPTDLSTNPAHMEGFGSD